MKLKDPWIDPRVLLVRPEAAQAYLVRRGWKPKPFKRPQVLLFEGPRANDGEPIVQVLPLAEKASDYPQRIIELITALAIIEDRYAVEVLNDILQQSPPADNGPDGSGKAARRKKAPHGSSK